MTIKSHNKQAVKAVKSNSAINRNGSKGNKNTVGKGKKSRQGISSVKKNSQSIPESAKFLDTNGIISGMGEKFYELEFRDRSEYCLFAAILNSMVGNEPVQKAIAAGNKIDSVQTALGHWKKCAVERRERWLNGVIRQGSTKCHVISANIGFRSQDVCNYLHSLKRNGFIKGFKYRKILMDDPRGVDIAVFANLEKRSLKNKRIILHGVTANAHFFKSDPVGKAAIGKPKGRAKKKRSVEPKVLLSERELERSYLEKIKVFHAQIEKKKVVDDWEKLQNQGRYAESEKEYPFCAHAVCLVYDCDGIGWIGNAAKNVWKKLTFESYIFDLVWTYSAYELDIEVELPKHKAGVCFL